MMLLFGGDPKPKLDGHIGTNATHCDHVLTRRNTMNVARAVQCQGSRYVCVCVCVPIVQFQHMLFLVMSFMLTLGLRLLLDTKRRH